MRIAPVAALLAAAALCGALPDKAGAQARCTYAACPREAVLTPAEAARVEAAVVRIADEVLAVAGRRRAIAFEPKGWVANARAYLRDGAPEIGYNPLWVRGLLDDPDGGAWRLRAVLAHEVGHHALDHPLGSADPHRRELEADAFAGFALRRLGATRDEAEALWHDLPVRATPTHPPRALRLAAVSGGWTTADGGGALAVAVAVAARLAP